MTETNLFQPIASLPLYSDNIGKVTLYDASHSNESEAQRIWTVTTIASLAYGNESAKNPEALYERMRSIKHESLWEFIRGFDDMDGYTIEDSLRNGDFGYYDTDMYTEGHSHHVACFRIKVPIFVARQFMRHRSFSYLEMSRRYTKDSKVPFEFWFPQGFNKEHKAMCIKDWTIDYERISTNYHTQIASRFLPQTTYTEFYMMGEVKGLRNYFKLRLDSHAQDEIRELSEAMLSLLQTHQPELYTKVLP